jgi:broad specificity phosphatase PhoE
MQRTGPDIGQRRVGWPPVLWIVRHGQSAGNAAAERANAAASAVIELEERDADVPLSPLGERQSHALARWFGALSAEQRPTMILSSPYRRAMQTARIVAEGLAPGGALPVFADERLREKDLGTLDRLTRRGWAERYPEQDEARRRLGKFYYRAPGGESWCDVLLRVRSASAELQLRYADQRPLIVAHQVVVLCLRYVIERLDEAAILRIDGEAEVANCSVTSYVCGDDQAAGPTLTLYNHVAPLEEAHQPVTAAEDAPVAPR